MTCAPTSRSCTTWSESKSELQEKILDLEKFEEVVVGRELKMIALEKELEALRVEVAKLQGGRGLNLAVCGPSAGARRRRYGRAARAASSSSSSASAQAEQRRRRAAAHHGRPERVEQAPRRPAQGDAAHPRRLRGRPLPPRAPDRAARQLAPRADPHPARLARVEPAARAQPQGDDPHHGRPARDDGGDRSAASRSCGRSRSS